MRILIQRVLEAEVIIDQNVYAKIGKGLLIFIGIRQTDSEKEAQWLANKCTSLRLFEDHEKKMNLSINQVNGEILIVSQFTLYGSCLKGRRPEFTESAKGEKAKGLYEIFIKEIKKLYPKVETGVFAADMKIKLLNDGPVTFMIEK